jgi:hypothetical protein
MSRISDIKRKTDIYLKKHHADSMHGLSEDIRTDYVTEICKLAARADIDKIETTVSDIFNYGYVIGHKSINNPLQDHDTISPAVKEKYKELAAVLSVYE